MIKGLDSYITSGRYRRTVVDCECTECGKTFEWMLCYEYGTCWYEPEDVACPFCGTEYKEE